jgi:hypothetical protein
MRVSGSKNLLVVFHLFFRDVSQAVAQKI